MTTKPGSKPANRWLDVQLVIATMAMTFTLFLWNIFAGAQNSPVTILAAEPKVGLLPEDDGNPVKLSGVSNTTQVSNSTTSVPAQPQSFGTILFGGSAPQISSVSAGSPGVAPIPVTTTGSSRP